jgi:hypothetical protein
MIAKKEDRMNILTVLNFNQLSQNFIFQIFFWVKAVSVVMMYAYGFKAAIQCSHPSYFTPQKWLQNLH